MIKYIIAIVVLWFLYRISTKKDEKGKESSPDKKSADKKPAEKKPAEKK